MLGVPTRPPHLACLLPTCLPALSTRPALPACQLARPCLAADKFNPLLGKSANTACQTCAPGASPRYTSNAGSAYCTVPWVDTTCGDGTEYDDSSATCVPCADGWKRSLASNDAACVAW